MQLRRDLSAFDIRTVQEMGWAGVRNGALIELAAAHFDAVFTVDRDFSRAYPRPLPVGVVILEVGSTDPVKLRPHMSAVAEALGTVQRGEMRRVGA